MGETTYKVAASWLLIASAILLIKSFKKDYEINKLIKSARKRDKELDKRLKTIIKQDPLDPVIDKIIDSFKG